jgi:hypothetical protein
VKNTKVTPIKKSQLQRKNRRLSLPKIDPQWVMAQISHDIEEGQWLTRHIEQASRPNEQDQPLVIS